jgi:hypothetical protein
MIFQLNPVIPLYTPKGEGIAFLVIDYGIEHDLIWVVAINDTSEIWCFRNREVNAVKNITLGRLKSNENLMTTSDRDDNLQSSIFKMEFDHGKNERKQTC